MLQLNSPVKAVPELKVFPKEVQKLWKDTILFPVLWADEGADLDEENADKLKSLLITPIKAVNIISIVLGVVLGSVAVILSLAIVIIWMESKQ